MNLDKEYWNSRYDEGTTGWDAGTITTPLKEYFDQLEDKEISILIPGCGNGHEAEYLFDQGFKNIFVLDISELALRNFAEKAPRFPGKNLINANFFEVAGSYDLIIEQTFFCALDPSLRQEYATKMQELLKPGGKLVGLLFDDPLNDDHPPFGGNEVEYRKYFEPLFDFIIFENCYNSIKPRQGRELFIMLQIPQNSRT